MLDKRASFVTGPIDLSAQPEFAIGRARVDPVSHAISLGERREHLQPLVMKVLVAMAQRRGELVTRDELVERCWDGRIVGDDVINRAVLLLRNLARDLGNFSIETVPKAGYRLIEHDAASPPRGRLLIAVALLGAILFAAMMAGRSPPPPSSTDLLQPTVALRSFAADSDPDLRAVAEAIDGSLLHSMGNSGLAPRRLGAGETPNGDLLLTGTVRRSGAGLVADLRLEEVGSRALLLAKRFTVPAGEAATLPDRVGAYAAATLTWAGALIVLDRRRPLDPDTKSQLLLQNAIAIEQGDWMRAYELSRSAARQAPDSPFAQLGLAMHSGFVLGDLPEAEQPRVRALGLEAAARARSLAPSFGDTYLPICLLGPLDAYAACEDSLRLGMKADPEAPFVSAYLRRWLAIVGQTEEATNYAKVSLAGAPYMPSKIASAMVMLEVGGDSAAADELYRNGRRWWPDFPVLFPARLSAMAQRGAWDEVSGFAAAQTAANPDLARFAVDLAAAVTARRLGGVRGACANRADPDRRTSLCLAALASLGDLDTAFAVADRAYPPIAGNRRYWRGPRAFNQLIDDPTFLWSPVMAAFRADPRFVPLAERLGLMAYWRSGRLPDMCRNGRSEALCARIAS